MMPAAVVSGSLAVVEWLRIASCKRLLVVLTMGFTGPLIIYNMKLGLEAPKWYFYHLLMVRAGHEESPEINTAFGYRKYR